MNIDSLKFLTKFSDEYLFEEVTSTYLIVNTDEVSPSSFAGGGAASLLPGGAGYIMTDDQYLLGTGISNAGYNFSSSDQVTIGFWLYPVCHGKTIDPSGDAVSISMPLLILSDASTYAQVIKVMEHTEDDNQNYITVSFNGNDLVLTSNNYTANLWHYIWMAFDRSKGDFSIYIDGKDQTLSTVGSTSTVVSPDSAYVYINYSQEGYSYNLAKNYGYIDDIFMLDESLTDKKEMQYVINNGIDYLADISLRDKLIDGYSIRFDDPRAITSSSIVNDMSYLYVGRNDGKILRGSPLFWESRKVYADDNEVDVVGIELSKSEGNGVENGLLKLKNTTIRL